MQAARAADLAMANADDDPAVSAVVGEGEVVGEGKEGAERSASPTPPPAPKLANTIAAIRARGEEPGV